MHPHPYTHEWHAHQNILERAWLDQWTRGHINPTTLHPEPADQAVPALAGSSR